MRPECIEIKGARVHNLKDVNLSIPLDKFVCIAGVSGSGKSSLALGILYAEGSRRYLDALSTYSRRRLKQPDHPSVDSIEHIPAALALRQRPPIPGIRSTFGTSSELLNNLRLLFSRIGSHRCPNGHYQNPTIEVALGQHLVCPSCNAVFDSPSAESFAFNSDGACKRCSGTAVVREVDEAKLVPDETLTIDQGAVAPWSLFGLSVNAKVVEEMGVRTNIPFRDLSQNEKDVVMRGSTEKRHILYPSKTGKLFDLNMTYRNAIISVEEALKNANTEKGLERIDRFLSIQICPDCHGTRLNDIATSSLVNGINLAQATSKTLADFVEWARKVPMGLSKDIQPMASAIVDGINEVSQRLIELGLGYISLDRPSSTLSTGERQRVQLSRAVRSRTTGILYVLDEPSIGLHPANIDGLLSVIHSLISDGNSVVVVDHDVQVLRKAQWLIEIGPGSGVNGGEVINSSTVSQAVQNSRSLIARFIEGREKVRLRSEVPSPDIFAHGKVSMKTRPVHTVSALDFELPKKRLVSVTGISGSGKTTLILECLVPALKARFRGEKLPASVEMLEAEELKAIHVVDASPIGANSRSTVATYCGVLDELRRAYGNSASAKRRKLKAGDFSYNTGSLRCPSCDGTGQLSLDVQFLADVDITCPNCHGSRYRPETALFSRSTSSHPNNKTMSCVSLPELLKMTIDNAMDKTVDLKNVHSHLNTLVELGLGYLTLGEATTALSGGEAQRLKLSADLRRDQRGSVFVFDEPSVGLHPLDIKVLLHVLEKLVDKGATVICIEHDLDIIQNSDYIVDLGPGGGAAGGKIVATGSPSQVAANTASITGSYLSS